MGALRLVAASPIQGHPYYQLSEFSQPAKNSVSSSSSNFHIFDCVNEGDDDFGCSSTAPGPSVDQPLIPGSRSSGVLSAGSAAWGA
jgi:hypothetical protein